MGWTLDGGRRGFGGQAVWAAGGVRAQSVGLFRFVQFLNGCFAPTARTSRAGLLLFGLGESGCRLLRISVPRGWTFLLLFFKIRRESPQPTVEEEEEFMKTSVEQKVEVGEGETLAVLLAELEAYVKAGAREGKPAHEVEGGIWRRMLRLGGGALGLFFELVGDGGLGEEVELEDGHRVRRLPALHDREYFSVFGSFQLSRAVYGTREGQKMELIPLDQRLQLPESKFSYLLQDWDQSLAVEDAFATGNGILNKILGFSQSVDSLERMNRKMAQSVPEFWGSLPAPAPSEEGELLVISADGKGVVMRRPAGESPIETHQRAKGPKPETRKQALVGSTYTVDRFSRTPEEVCQSLFRNPAENSHRARTRPKPQHKRVRASLARNEAGQRQPAVEEIFGWMAQENQLRNPSGNKPLVLLMDGETSLWQAAQAHLPQDSGTVEILDLLHVTPRLWKAAYLFHRERSAPAIQFVKDRVSRVLHGEVGSVILGLRRMGTKRLQGKKLKTLRQICRYLEKNRDRLCYDDYLEQGYPIATGVIEGACRHLVKDRMERTGMSWVRQGAQAMLDLRSVHIADQWDEFTAFRIRKENERLYPHMSLTEEIEWPIAA